MLLFKRDFRRNFKSLLIWTLIMAGLMLMMLSIYPQFAKQQEALDQMINVLPEAMLKAFNMDKLNMNTVLGYYAVECYIMITLVGSIYAAMLGSSILSKEESGKTIEFLLSKPITRTSIVSQKLLLVVTNLVIFNADIALVNLLGFSFSKNTGFDMKAFILLTIGPLLMHILFAFVAFMISSIIHKSRNTVSISLGLVFITYFLNLVASMSEKFDFLKYFSPFKYIDSADLIIDKAIKAEYLVIMIAVITVSAVVTYAVYHKKDIVV